jgi:NADPH-dependent 2,4-dienoyl-CoA reductase/sulfur reductase-like enzyme
MGKDALCIHNVATGRERILDHAVEPSSGAPKTVVVVGGGPGGLEAARVAALRGHRVVLFEASGELGGQILLAARATWRRELLGIARWLAGEMGRLGVDVRLNTLAQVSDVVAATPDAVIIATGGLPDTGQFPGQDLAATVWDVLSGDVAALRAGGGEALVVDMSAGHAPLSCAEVLASKGAKVELVTPDRAPGLELSDTNLGAHMAEIYRAGIKVTPDTRLVSLSRSGNGLIARLANSYSGAESERHVDLLVADSATLPNADLYEELKPLSHNAGAVDLDRMVAGRAQPTNGSGGSQGGGFGLYRIGDAWAARNIHAAILDAMRLCRDL